MAINSAKVLVRYAKADDVARISSLFREVVAPLSIYTEQARAAEIEKYSDAKLMLRVNHDPQSVCVAECNDRVVGFAITEDQSGPIWIEWYGVANDMRRHGVGRKILNFLIEQLPQRKATKLWCDSRVNNIPSIALFEELKFHKLCEVSNHWFGQDFYLWELKA